MILHGLVVFFFLLILVNAKPIRENLRQNDYHKRSSRQIINWQLADKLYKRLFERNNYPFTDDQGDTRFEIPQELRPVGGPINIEQLPAMLAARYVKRYPYSQYDDPAVIGR